MFRSHVRYIFPSELTGTRIIPLRLGRLYRTCQRLRQLARFLKNPITEPFFSLLSLFSLSAGGLFLRRLSSFLNRIHVIAIGVFRLRKRRMKRNGRSRACWRMADRWRSVIIRGHWLAFVIQQRSYEKSRMRSRQSTLAVSHGMPITNTCPNAS